MAEDGEKYPGQWGYQEKSSKIWDEILEIWIIDGGGIDALVRSVLMRCYCLAKFCARGHIQDPSAQLRRAF